MTRDDILRMAREAGLKAAGDYDFRGSYESMPLFEREELDRVLKFANLVAAEEREACARMFDMPDYLNGEQEDWFREVAATIRARGE